MSERADATWVLSVHETEARARAAEARYAFKHGIPTLPFVARRGRSENGLVHARSDGNREGAGDVLVESGGEKLFQGPELDLRFLDVAED